MSETLYLSMFTRVQSSSFDRKRKLRSRIAERLGRFAIYGAMVTAFAMNATEPTMYASIASACCLALECFR